MAAYTVIRTQVHDPEAYSAFVERVTALMPEFGGEFAVRADRCVTLEGEEPPISSSSSAFPTWGPRRRTTTTLSIRRP